jgi:hydroxymethylpyrimidine/phosphomethylpyrimidine kinase
MTATTPPVALTIAGSDSSGGAGIQADLRTFAAYGVHGASALTALTAQNTVGVQGVHTVPPGFVRAQVDSVVDDLTVAATKTGMLATAAIVSCVAEVVAQRQLPNLVVDPVMVASTGARLLDPEAELAYLDRLIPLARVVTPNRVEAGVLCGRELRTLADMADAALQLAALGPEVVVVKGGDADDEGDEAVDVVAVAAGGRIEHLRAPRVGTANDHGTGCSFASAIAASLALGHDHLSALRSAKAFVSRALAGAAGWRLGAGHGPIDHLGWGLAPDPTAASPSPGPHPEPNGGRA